MIEMKNATKFFHANEVKKYILKNVTLTIPDGVNVGILGRNGAGKSTLLRMLGGIEFPNSGEIISDKSFSWPMGLAGGFQGSMTGRQNVKFVCRVYGKSDEEIKKIANEVQEFAEIGEYFDMPIKIYSSGMKSRLSFGLSLAFDFDYLIIDETLSVGDENFKKKAKKALEKKIEQSNVLLVSHSMGDLKKICDVGIVVHDGALQYFEKIEDAVAFYHQLNQITTSSSPGKVQSSAIYCDDGQVFDNVTEAAKFYKVRPMAIIQALEKNRGSNVFLKKVFWRDGTNKYPYQPWQELTSKTLVCSDGIVFDNVEEVAYFYMDRVPKAGIDVNHLRHILKDGDGMSKKLNVKFHYLSEYQ